MESCTARFILVSSMRKYDPDWPRMACVRRCKRVFSTTSTVADIEADSSDTLDVFLEYFSLLELIDDREHTALR